MSARLCGDPRERRRTGLRRSVEEPGCRERLRLRDRRITALDAPAGRLSQATIGPRQAWSVRSLARERAALLHAVGIAQRWPGAASLDVSLRISDGLSGSGLLNHTLAAVLSETGFPAERLQLEFSETALHGDDPDLLFTLATLRDLGVVPIMGGFGGGISSLSLLRRRSLAGLLGAVKLDATLVRDSSERDADFLRGLVCASHALGLLVVADGIDSIGQIDLLVAAGCDEGLGAVSGFLAALDDLR
nr:EAL domain-containing protein [uncultured Lichenicoccus sp.]